MKKRIIALLTVFLLTVVMSLCTYLDSGDLKHDVNKGDQLKITFIDVGQGDSVLVQCGAQTMLIDAGTTDAEKEVLTELEKNKIGKIDILIGTHPHEDHIGSMDTVINKFDIGKIYMPKITTNTNAFKDVLTCIKNKGLSITVPVPGSSFKLGNAECTILAPNSSKYEEINNYSIVIKMVFGETSYLFTGDAQSLSEQEMLENGCNLKADVLKVGHHGSSSSTCKDFLDTVAPGYAVIMCGKNNDYKHPHKETMNRLKKAGIPVYRTDESGSVVCTSDGRSINFSSEPDSYKYSRK